MNYPPDNQPTKIFLLPMAPQGMFLQVVAELECHCGKIYSSITKAFNHHEKVHGTDFDTCHTCGDIDLRSRSLEGFKLHLLSKSGGLPIKNVYENTSMIASAEVAACDDQDGSFFCVCGRTYPSVKELEGHQENRHGTKLQYEDYLRMFSSRIGLRKKELMKVEDRKGTKDEPMKSLEVDKAIGGIETRKSGVTKKNEHRLELAQHKKAVSADHRKEARVDIRTYSPSILGGVPSRDKASEFQKRKRQPITSIESASKRVKGIEVGARSLREQPKASQKIKKRTFVRDDDGDRSLIKKSLQDVVILPPIPVRKNSEYLGESSKLPRRPQAASRKPRDTRSDRSIHRETCLQGTAPIPTKPDLKTLDRRHAISSQRPKLATSYDEVFKPKDNSKYNNTVAPEHDVDDEDGDESLKEDIHKLKKRYNKKQGKISFLENKIAKEKLQYEDQIKELEGDIKQFERKVRA